MKYRALPEVSSTTIVHDTVAFHPGSEKYFKLNETGGFLLGHLKTPCTLDELSKRLHEGFSGISRSESREIVQTYLDRLISQGIVESVADE